jgi:hypothetical protein
MPFMPPTDESDRVWESDGLEIYVVKRKGRVFVKVRSPGRPRERVEDSRRTLHPVRR